MQSIRWQTIAAIVVSSVIVGAVAWVATFGLGSYGWTLFVAAPVTLGYLAAAVYRWGGPKALRRCIGVACAAALVVALGFLALGWEGLVCIFLAAPLWLPLVIAGACLGYLLLHKGRWRPGLTSTVVVAFAVALEVIEANLEIEALTFRKATSLRVEASTAEVWEAMIRLERMPESADWVFRTGVAYPETARMETARAGGLRICRLSTGMLVERIEVWQPRRQLRWRALATPPPLRELNPFMPADPPHLHGFYEAVRGEFVLQPLSAGSTLVTRRTWYRHNLYPAQYWRFWCDLAAERIHLAVLRQIKRSAESRPSSLAESWTSVPGRQPSASHRLRDSTESWYPGSSASNQASAPPKKRKAMPG
jgi:hypothetical protein